MPSGPVRTRQGSRDVGLSLIRKLARGMGVAVPSASVSATLMRSRPLSWEEAASHNSSATIILTSYFLLLTSYFLLLTSYFFPYFVNAPPAWVSEFGPS